MPWGPPLTSGQLVVGVTYVRRCVNLATGATSTTTVTARPPTPPTTQRAEKQAPTPDIGLSPDPSVGTVLGIPTWMWIRNFTETDPVVLENGSVGVLARLVPRYVIWDLDDDGPTPDDADVVRCDGPGVPWSASAEATAPVDAVCTYSFRHRGTHHVTATIWWDVPFYDTVSHLISYLPPVSSTASVDIAAHELDTVIRDR